MSKTVFISSLFIGILSSYFIYKLDNNVDCSICYNTTNQLVSICSKHPNLHKCCKNCRTNIIQSSEQNRIIPRCPFCREVINDYIQFQIDTLNKEPSLLLNNAIQDGNLEEVIHLQRNYNLVFTLWNLHDAIEYRQIPIIIYLLDQNIGSHPNLVQLAINKHLPNEIINRLR